MIGIRADANDIVASGHIMRCITIAKQLKKLGEEVVFFLADGYGVPMLQENAMQYVVMDTDWEHPLEEVEVLCREIAQQKVHTMLLDSYKMTKEYFTKLRELLGESVRLAYIDDLFEDVYPVDVVINYNAYYTGFPYENVYDAKTTLCLGPSYVPLREEFGKRKRKDGDENSVLLSCGGGDSLQSMYGILKKATEDERFANVYWHVVVGRYHQKKECLEQLAACHEQVILHHNVSNMAQQMENCKIAVSAAGTMLYELCAMERPTVFFITADNQRYDSDYFAEDGRMLFAGDIRLNRDVCIGQILDGIHTLLHDSGMRMEMKEKLRKVTDGNGAERIAKVLMSIGEKSC